MFDCVLVCLVALDVFSFVCEFACLLVCLRFFVVCLIVFACLFGSLACFVLVEFRVCLFVCFLVGSCACLFAY